MKKEGTFEGTLLERVFKGIQPDELAELAAKLLGNPVALLDAAHTLAGVSSNYPPDDLQDRFNRNELLEQNGQGCKYFSAEFWVSLRSGVPFSAPLLYLRRGHMLCGCTIHKRIAGIVMLPDVGVPFKELDESLICSVARSWGVLLLLNNRLKGTGSFADQEMLRSLLARPEHGDSILREKSPAYIPFNGGKRFRMLHIAGDAETIGDAFCQLCTIPAPNESGGLAAIVCDPPEYDRDVLEKAAFEHNAQVGISGSFSNLADTAKYYEQAKKALYYCRIMKDDSLTALYDEYRFISMLDSVKDRESYFDSRLSILKEYDDENQTAYLKTLGSYLLLNHDAAAVAKKLHIHKNTLLYRLNRIKELFNIDLHDCMQLSSMYCSLIMQSLDLGNSQSNDTQPHSHTKSLKPTE